MPLSCISFWKLRRCFIILKLTLPTSFKRKLSICFEENFSYEVHNVFWSNVEGSTFLAVFGNKTWQICTAPHSLITLDIYIYIYIYICIYIHIFPPVFLPRGKYGSPKLLKYMYLKLAQIQINFCSPPRQGSLTLKSAAFEDVYLRPVASKASGGRILKTN